MILAECSARKESSRTATNRGSSWLSFARDDARFESLGWFNIAMLTLPLFTLTAGQIETIREN